MSPRERLVGEILAGVWDRLGNPAPNPRDDDATAICRAIAARMFELAPALEGELAEEVRALGAHMREAARIAYERSEDRARQELRAR